MSKQVEESVVEFAVNMASETEIDEVLSKQEGESIPIFLFNNYGLFFDKIFFYNLKFYQEACFFNKFGFLRLWDIS